MSRLWRKNPTPNIINLWLYNTKQNTTLYTHIVIPENTKTQYGLNFLVFV